MNERENMQLQLRRYYTLWKDCSAVYEEWARAQGLSDNGVLVLYSFYEGDEPVTQKSISRRWLIPKQTVNTILKDFMKKGYVEMVAMEEDKRNKLVRLTDSGKEFADAIIGKLQKKELMVMEEMGLESMTEMNDTLEKFIGLFKAGGSDGNNGN